MISFAVARARIQTWAASRWAARAGTVLARVGATRFVVSVPVALVGSDVRYLFGEQRLYSVAIDR